MTPGRGHDDDSVRGRKEASAGRAVRLRRPPRLARVDGPFVPEGCDLDEVDRRWRLFRAAIPGAFDGPVLQVLGVHRDGHGGATLHVVETSYRFWAVQIDRPAITGLERGIDLGVRPLGAKAIVRERATARGDEGGADPRPASTPVLFAQRSAATGAYPRQWEVAPGGVVEPGESPRETVVRELAEETGLVPLGAPRAILVLEDPEARCWELVHAIDVAEGSRDRSRISDEHDDMGWFDPSDPPRPLTPIAARILGLAVGP